MSLDATRLLEHVHGHLGWLASASLLHPAIVLRRLDRRAHLAVVSGTLLPTIASALGAWLYDAYRERLKQVIFTESTSTGLLFERKEHLAFAAVLLSWAACAAYFGALGANGELRTVLRRLAFRGFVAAAALAIAVAAIGTTVAVFRSF